LAAKFGDEVWCVFLMALHELVVDKEETVEQALLTDAGDFLISRGIEHQVAVAIRMPPAAIMVVGWPGADERDEMHFSF
jgi:hypothetical protein